ncbi:MAG: hypothetical protein KDA78_00755 [Planctomycetaceae bacterium]|nr:hypothetical protein [Planctomycetaceae bacterium]
MRFLLLNMFLMVTLFVIGCGSNPASGPFGEPESSPLMVPFAGTWTLEFEKTLEAQKAAGVSEEQIEQTRKFFADHPQFGKMHPDLTFEGNVAVGEGVISSEYRFFSMHTHDSQTCGKAWHLEDRFDPGDMSKCFVRLEVIEGLLYMEVYMQEGLPDLDDPDLLTEPSVEGDPLKCEYEAKAGNHPEERQVLVFSRRE